LGTDRPEALRNRYLREALCSVTCVTCRRIPSTLGSLTKRLDTATTRDQKVWRSTVGGGYQPLGKSSINVDGFL
jgi:hypothetical protein